MRALSSDLRRDLEKAVLKAREKAELAANAALNRLAVGAAEAHREMSADERQLRNQLRARGRQLGDVLGTKGTQGIAYLATECAYEHWHQMLFARFLSENHLLMHPDGVPVSIEECQELAADEGAPDGWALAARYASRMLPQVFRPDDPVLKVPFAPEHRLALEEILAKLNREVFTADDSLGWVYQFWQVNEKERVNKSGNKIGADELPAVTQLFTEHYMVLFLLHNTVGAWWVANHPGEKWPERFEYLRLMEDGIPAAGAFAGWPKTVKELRVLDPCCGSGHFLVAVFDLLVRLRMLEEGLDAQAAADAVLSENIFGLEIDPRCTQIAAFALALAAWKLEGAGGYRELAKVNVACSGIAPRGKREEWLGLANGNERLRAGMDQLYDLFKQAPLFGSLIDPRAGTKASLYTAEFAELQPLLESALKSEKNSENLDLTAAGVSAKGIAKAAQILTGRYTLVITNVPYLARGKQSKELRDFSEVGFSSAKLDLATVFLERTLAFCAEGCSSALVTPQNWLFQTGYRKLREGLLSDITFTQLTRLGPGAFETISGEVVKVILVCISKVSPNATTLIRCLDASDGVTPNDKARKLRSAPLTSELQAEQLRHSDSRITLSPIASHDLLAGYAIALSGLYIGDSGRFNRCLWEVPNLGSDWEFLQSTVERSEPYGGRSQIIFWENEKGAMYELARSVKHLNHAAQNWLRGKPSWGKRGVVVSQMGALYSTLFSGDRYDLNCCAIIPNEPENQAALWAFCSSPEFNNAVRSIDQALKVTSKSLLKIPFDLSHWQRIAEHQYPNGLPEPFSDDPTQWLFKGDVRGSNSPLQVAVARLMGYQWPEQPREEELDKLTDDDGIVCLPAVRGEQPATLRLQSLLAVAHGPEWSPAKHNELLASVDAEGKTLEQWVRDSFFEQHCSRFQQRPFIWHIWDGRRDGFSALVNYHKLDRRNLEKLIYTYLGDWIRRQEGDLARGESGADGRLLAAKGLQQKLEKILEGEPPYDIFVRWKPLEQQPLGWDPDLNDGVRLNIRPFMTAEVLRKAPKINWNKDRGKNPPGAPWGEDRLNDLHLSLAKKRTARDAALSTKLSK